MRVGMGLIKNEHGVWQVRKKVPKRLEAATATVLGNGKRRVSWLKETLRTKDKKDATITAKPVMMKFDRILADAEALLAERPLRNELPDAEIKRIIYGSHAVPRRIKLPGKSARIFGSTENNNRKSISGKKTNI